MIEIGNKIFCRSQVMNQTIGAASNSRHIVRRLINGVFKHEAVLKSTRTGQKFRPGLKNAENNQAPNPDVLHRKAADTIIGINLLIYKNLLLRLIYQVLPTKYNFVHALFSVRTIGR